MTLARDWLQECLDKHSNCPPGLRDVALPTRVIYVGSSARDPFLHESKGETGKYASLSYCWGRPPHPWITTPSTLDDRRQSIPLQDLPKTIRDAVVITRHLGIQWLWVDALCIIQKSADWDKEAGRMGDYYGNATVTISADGSTNSHTGCFVSGNRRLSTAVPVMFEGRPARIYVRVMGAWPLEGSHPPMGTPGSIPNMLSTRGWALQEQLLSPRILRYTSSELVWECATHMRCECSVRPKKPLVMLLRRRLIREGYPSRTALDEAKSSRNVKEVLDGLLLQWNQVVYDFSLRSLTYASDRLPALSGLAAVMQRRTGDEYIAGLWKNELAIWLCWQTHIPQGTATGALGSLQSPSSRQLSYCAPSWSWASVTGPVHIPLADREFVGGKEALESPIDIRLDILGVYCTPAGSNLFGSLSNGELRCSGRAMLVTLHRHRETAQLYVKCLRSSGTSDPPTALVYRDTYDHNSEIEVGRSYTLLIVLSHRPARNDPEYPSLMYGLLLLESRIGTYKRVGLAVGFPNEVIGRYFTADWEAVAETMEMVLV